MIQLQKDRTLVIGQQVEVYRNLNRGKVFSIKDKKTGLVVAWADRFMIENVICKVREGGRQRVIKDKRKNVHAFLVSNYAGECEMDISTMNELYYDPFNLDSFINKETGEKVIDVESVYFEDGKAFIK